MVIIAGGTIDVSAIINEYPQGGAERQVLETMSKSAGKYSFSSLDELKFELKFRKAVVDAAMRLNRSGMRFAVFNKSKCNETYWNRTDNGGFELKEGADPAAAINDIILSGRKYATECATAMVIVFYKAALDVYGPETFGKLFSNIYLMNWHGIDPLLQDIGAPRRVDNILTGDRVYFSNPDVEPKNPEWQGENAIVLPGGVYYGHGAGIRTADEIIKMLNRLRKKDATRSAYMRDDASRPDYRMLYRAYVHYAAQTTPAPTPVPAPSPTTVTAPTPAPSPSPTTVTAPARETVTAPTPAPAPAAVPASAHIVWGPWPEPVARGIRL